MQRSVATKPKRHVIYRYLDEPRSDELELLRAPFMFSAGEIIDRHGSSWRINRIFTQPAIDEPSETHTIWVCLVKTVLH
jgi:hypothetical protein